MERPLLPQTISREGASLYPSTPEKRSRIHRASQDSRNTQEESYKEDETNSLNLQSLAHPYPRTRSILKNKELGKSGQLSSRDDNCKKKITFMQTEVHLVENWKKYNKARKPCCFSFIR